MGHKNLIFSSIFLACLLVPALTQQIVCDQSPLKTLLQLRCILDSWPPRESTDEVVIYRWPKNSPDAGDYVLTCRKSLLQELYNCSKLVRPFKWQNDRPFCLLEPDDPSGCLTVVAMSNVDVDGEYACKFVPERSVSQRCQHTISDTGEPLWTSQLPESTTARKEPKDGESSQDWAIIIVIAILIGIGIVIVYCIYVRLTKGHFPLSTRLRKLLASDGTVQGLTLNNQSAPGPDQTMGDAPDEEEEHENTALLSVATNGCEITDAETGSAGQSLQEDDDDAPMVLTAPYAEHVDNSCSFDNQPAENVHAFQPVPNSQSPTTDSEDNFISTPTVPTFSSVSAVPNLEPENGKAINIDSDWKEEIKLVIQSKDFGTDKKQVEKYIEEIAPIIEKLKCLQAFAEAGLLDCTETAWLHSASELARWRERCLRERLDQIREQIAQDVVTDFMLRRHVLTPQTSNTRMEQFNRPMETEQAEEETKIWTNTKYKGETNKKQYHQHQPNHCHQSQHSSVAANVTLTQMKMMRHSQGSFVEEDIDAIPKSLKEIGRYRSGRFQDFCLFDALQAIIMIKLRLQKSALDPQNPLTSIKGRFESFPANWTGPSPTRMAEAGFCYNEGVYCVYCEVRLRCLNVPDRCPWQEHQNYMPFCLHLVKFKCDGMKPTPQGKRRRRHSQSSACDVLRRCGKVFL